MSDIYSERAEIMDAKEIEFKAHWPFVKEVSGLRAKGVRQEEILDEVDRAFGNEVGTFMWDIGIGVPSGFIGVKNAEEWKGVKEYLRAKGLLR